MASSAKRATNRLLLGCGLALSACSSRLPSPADPPPGVSTVALGTPVEFVFDSLDNRPVTAQGALGKPTIIVFVTTSNLPAQAQVDFLVAMANHDKGRNNFILVALEPRDNRELVEIYRKALSVPFPVAMADDATLSGRSAFGDLSGVPVTVMLDRAGRLVWRVEGRVVKSSELRDAMRGL